MTDTETPVFILVFCNSFFANIKKGASLLLLNLFITNKTHQPRVVLYGLQVDTLGYIFSNGIYISVQSTTRKRELTIAVNSKRNVFIFGVFGFIT